MNPDNWTHFILTATVQELWSDVKAMVSSYGLYLVARSENSVIMFGCAERTGCDEEGDFYVDPNSDHHESVIADQLEDDPWGYVDVATTTSGLHVVWSDYGIQGAPGRAHFNVATCRRLSEADPSATCLTKIIDNATGASNWTVAENVASTGPEFRHLNMSQRTGHFTGSATLEAWDDMIVLAYEYESGTNQDGTSLTPDGIYAVQCRTSSDCTRSASWGNVPPRAFPSSNSSAFAGLRKPIQVWP